MLPARLQTSLTAVETVYDLVYAIEPLDDLEAAHRIDALNWIDSGVEIFRLAKPATPPKHLVSYFALYDSAAKKVLLVDHKKALRWVPTGGHVELGEDPTDTVRRESQEELGIHADFLYPAPLFITCIETVGLTAGHEDVSLWYVLKGDSGATFQYDRDEFNDIAWFDIDRAPLDRADPHLGRFLNKLMMYENK
jgi:8-oxo-dGTP diphosphatase